MAEATGLPLSEVEAALAEPMSGGGEDAFWQWSIGDDVGQCSLCGLIPQQHCGV
jgi:hypothetical protein